jgi:D-serine dehydratase
MNLGEVRRVVNSTIAIETIDQRFKGFPVSAGVTIDTVAEQRWNLFAGDFSLPVMILKRDALDHNLERMAEYCENHGVLLAPHAKTTMSPQLVLRQMEAGAWGITVASVSQARLFTAYGLRRVIIANEVVTPSDLQWISEARRADPGLEIFVLVDSLAGVSIMDAALESSGNDLPPLTVLLELGYAGGRAGCRNPEEAYAVAQAISDSDHLALAGVEGFEGLIPGSTREEQVTGVRSFLARITETIHGLQIRRLLPNDAIVTCGGSAFFDEVAKTFVEDWPGKSLTVVLRSGCYVTHDHGLYAESSPLRSGDRPLIAALEVWATVLSRPDDTLAILGCGRRDVPYDAGLPTVISVLRDGTHRSAAGMGITALNDHHAFVTVEDGVDLRVGDLVALGISHPCTAFDKWPLIPVVDADYNVVDAVKTYF